VFGWARLLQGNHLQDPSHVARATDAIVRNADAQVRLIDDLLDLSRISSGKMQLAMQPASLADVRQGALDAIRPSADEKGIRISVVIDDPADGTVMGDGARLQQIVWNLLANAVKFTGNGGEILLRQRRTDHHIEIAVSDTGQGIAPDVLPHVFDRFRQGDSSSTRSHRGLGLGLALVKELVQLHGGTVHAQSDGIGRGSTFTVLLPIALAAPPKTAVAPPALSDEALKQLVRLDGVRVIVADDENDARSLAEMILGTAGAEVRTCPTAADAIELLKVFRPRVLVSDLEMPDEDGYSLIGRVRTLPADEGGATPAVALSAYGRPQDRMRAVAAGFNMHVPKPVDPGELTAIVASLAGLIESTASRPVRGKIPSAI
jgi:CheY-like chemotaxis protein